MYRPRTYERLMAYAAALRVITDHPIWGLVPSRGKRTFAYRVAVHQERFLRRLFARYDDLVEHVYLLGHDEGYREGGSDARNQIEADREAMGSGADFA